MEAADQNLERARIREILENWSIGRDAGDWPRLAATWHDDGVMHATWFRGPAREFIDIAKRGWQAGGSSAHMLGGMAVDLDGARAVAQTKLTLCGRFPIDGVVCDTICLGRFHDLLEKRDGRWGLVLRSMIYERDRLDPVDPAARLILDAAGLDPFPPGYRYLAYAQAKNGRSIPADLPGLSGPAADEVHARGRAWLSAAPADPSPQLEVRQPAR